MRTTLDIEDDVLAAAKALGRRAGKTAGAMLSELARAALGAGLLDRERNSPVRVAEPAGFYGFEPLPSDGRLVTDEVIDRLREEAGD